MDGNPSASAGDMGLIPGLEDSTWNKLSPCATTTEAHTHLEPVFLNKRSHSNEKHPRCKEEKALLMATRESRYKATLSTIKKINK